MCLKLVRGMSGAPLAYVVRCHIKAAHISPGSGTYLNIDKEMIARGPIVNVRLNLKLNQDTFKMDNSMV